MQNRRAFLFLLLAIVFGVAAAFTARRWLEEQRRLPAEAKATTRPVVVVRSDVAVGASLEDRQLITVDWPLQYVPQGVFGKPSQVVGRVLGRPLASGEPVLSTSLLPEGSPGGLMSVIDPSHRAISVRVDPVVGVAGFVVPGSHVDVIVTTRRFEEDRAQPYSKVVLQDVKVLAIDQKLEEAKGGEPALVQVVTLEVTPEQAEKLTYAAHEAKLQLALRNPTDRDIVETRGVSVGDLIGQPRPPKPVVARAAPAAPRSTTDVEVIKGARISVESF